MEESPTFAAIEETVGHTGLQVIGGFHPESGDALPRVAGTAILLGNAGSGFWARFEGGPEANEAGLPDPLDTWTRRVLDEVARDLGADILYPFDGPPYYPFQKWAVRAANLSPSPVGPLIHPDYGLWNAYRGLLLFDRFLDLPPTDTRPPPCETCRDKPCLSACPADAIRPNTGPEIHFDMGACLGHLKSPAGGACREGGCRARLACPVGPSHRYSASQSAHHLTAFVDRYG